MVARSREERQTEPLQMQTLTQIGVIFDMDGVLVDSAESHYESWRTLAAQQGVDVCREQFATTFGRQNRDIVPLLFPNAGEEHVDVLAERKEAIYRDIVRNNPPIVPGAVELIRSLNECGVRLAIGSSAPRQNIDLILNAMGVADLIGVIVSDDDVTRGKPDPQVFTLACERLDLSPQQCVVVEDAPAGVTAARAAGTRSVAVLLYHEAQAFEHADLFVDRLADLTVESLNGCTGAR